MWGLTLRVGSQKVVTVFKCCAKKDSLSQVKFGMQRRTEDTRESSWSGSRVILLAATEESDAGTLFDTAVRRVARQATRRLLDKACAGQTAREGEGVQLRANCLEDLVSRKKSRHTQVGNNC